MRGTGVQNRVVARDNGSRPVATSTGQVVPREHAARPSNPTVSVVVPTLNEARNLPYAFSRLPSCVTEIVLVDGRSRDDTIEVAGRLRDDVRIARELEPGKGAALGRGFSEATGGIILRFD